MSIVEVGDALIYVGYTKVGKCTVIEVNANKQSCNVSWETGEKSTVYFNELVDDIRKLGFVNLNRAAKYSEIIVETGKLPVEVKELRNEDGLIFVRIYSDVPFQCCGHGGDGMVHLIPLHIDEYFDRYSDFTAVGPAICKESDDLLDEWELSYDFYRSKHILSVRWIRERA